MFSLTKDVAYHEDPTLPTSLLLKKESSRCLRPTRIIGFSGLGILFLLSLLVTPALISANELVKSMASKNDATAQYLMGRQYLTNFSVKQNFTTAIHWFNKSASQNYANAQYELGLLYKNGHGVKRDYKKSYEYFFAAAKQEHIMAMFEMGNHYYLGLHVPADDEKALYWFQKSETYIHKDSIKMASYIRNKNGKNKKSHQGQTTNITPDNKLLSDSGLEHQLINYINNNPNGSDLISPMLQYRIGMLYLHGPGLAYNSDKGVAWLEKAAMQKYSAAQYELGIHYKNAKGINQDLNKALNWLQKAANNGSNEANDALVTLLDN